MSDTPNDTTSPGAAQGFTPGPQPPQVDAAEINDVLADDDPAHATATKALQAVQTLVENNRAASQQLESLMGIVLDAAEVANRSASAVAATGTQLNKAAEKLSDGARSASMQNKIVLALCGSVLVGTAATFSFMTVQLNQKVEQVDAMLLAVGKRAVDLKTRMESLDEIHAALADINLKQDNNQSVQLAIEDKLNAAVEAAKSPFKSGPDKPEKPVPADKADKAGKVADKTAPKATDKTAEKTAEKTADKGDKPVKPEKPAPRVARESELSALSRQFAGIDAQLKEQSNAVRALSSQVNNVQNTATNLDGLKRDVESLAALQKQRYQEALQATAQATAKLEKELKDKERELAREREVLKERERAQAKERELLQSRDKEKEKERGVQYSRDQSRPNGNTASNGLPSYTRQPETDTN